MNKPIVIQNIFAKLLNIIVQRCSLRLNVLFYFEKKNDCSFKTNFRTLEIYKPSFNILSFYYFLPMLSQEVFKAFFNSYNAISFHLDICTFIDK